MNSKKILRIGDLITKRIAQLKTEILIPHHLIEALQQTRCRIPETVALMPLRLLSSQNNSSAEFALFFKDKSLSNKARTRS
ncbi:MAG: hypothetical protein K2X53_02720 [Alphaproteobacteria bacterium]|nr:hypothetical protein [Alphaproteobacteria bacterium]